MSGIFLDVKKSSEKDENRDILFHTTAIMTVLASFRRKKGSHDSHLEVFNKYFRLY